jgi:hypothetical protein
MPQITRFSYSDWREHKLWPPVWALGIVPILWGGFSLVFLHIYVLINKLWRSFLCWALGISVNSTLLFCSLLWKSRYFAFPELPVPSPQLRETIWHCIVFPSYAAAWKLSPERKGSNYRAYLLCFLSLKNPLPSLSDLQCFENCHFIIFVLFINCFMWKEKYNPCSSILAGRKSQFVVFKHSLLHFDTRKLLPCLIS